MNVKKQKSKTGLPAVAGSAIDRNQRRALARLGLLSVGPYAAPTLLALRSAVGPSMTDFRAGTAA